MATVLIVIHIMLVVALIVLVLLQRSEGGALGIGGGGGGGGSFMSSRGAADTMTRTTSFVAAGFFATSIALGVLAARDNRTEDILNRAAQPGQAQTVPSDDGGASAPPSSAGSLLDDLGGLPGDQPATPQPGQVPTGE